MRNALLWYIIVVASLKGALFSPTRERHALIERMRDDLIHDAAFICMYFALLLNAQWARVCRSVNGPELLICNRRRNVYLFKVTHYRGKQAEPTVFTPQTSRSISHYKL